MKILKRTVLAGFKAFLGFIGIVFLYFLTAFILSSIATTPTVAETPEVPIFILSNGVHTDLVLPYRNQYYDWSRLVQRSQTMATDSSYTYIALGWGDKGFYLQTPEWKDLKASVALKAATGLSSTAIHATFHRQLSVSENCKSTKLSKAQYLALVSYIANTFSLDEKGGSKYIETKAQYGDHDAFYEAKGSYSIFTTCNTWANTGLKRAGQKACLWTIFDKPILKKYP